MRRICTDSTMKLFSLLLPATCILLCEGARMKIINGRIVAANSRPYMALINIENATNIRICGGSLIDKSWVLTASHCDVPEPDWTIQVILGVHSRKHSNNLWQEFQVGKSVKHPNYNESNLNNDLWLIKLSKEAKLNKSVKILQLPKTFDDLKEGTVCETAGWGKTKNGALSDYLLEVNMTVLNRETCTTLYEHEVIKVTDNMMCTSVGPQGQDTCNGDSGGPLICSGVFTAVTSSGPKICGKPNKASVFTRLTKKYIDWIHKEIKKTP